jgi:hypothetical protein
VQNELTASGEPEMPGLSDAQETLDFIHAAD